MGKSWFLKYTGRLQEAVVTDCEMVRLGKDAPILILSGESQAGHADKDEVGHRGGQDEGHGGSAALAGGQAGATLPAQDFLAQQPPAKPGRPRKAPADQEQTEKPKEKTKKSTKKEK